MRGITSTAALKKARTAPPQHTHNRIRFKSRMLAGAIATVPLLTAVSATTAATLYWDNNNNTPGPGTATPSQTWNAAAAKWSSSSLGDVTTGTWGAQNGTTAVFSAGTGATGNYTITVSDTEAVSGITFEEGSVTITGTGAATGTLDFGGNAALISIPINKNNSILTNIIGTGSSVLTITNSGADSTLNIDGSMTGFMGSIVLSAGTDSSKLNKLQLDGPLGDSSKTITLNSFSELGNNNQVTLPGGALTSTNYNIANPIVLAGSDAWLASANGPSGTQKVVTYSGAITGTGGGMSSGNLWIGINQTGGNGAVVLGGASTPTYNYSGNTYIVMAGNPVGSGTSNGLTMINKDNILPSTTNLVFGGTTASANNIGPFDLNQHNLQVGSLATTTTGTAYIFNTALDATPAAVTLTVGAGTATAATFNGIIGQTTLVRPYTVNTPYLNHVTASGNISVTKIGSNTQVFTNVNPYTGDTNVNGGTLVLAKQFGQISAPGTAANTVAGNVIINNSGSVLATAPGVSTNNTFFAGAGGRVTANNGAVISPGTDGQVGGLYVAGGLTLNGGSTLKFDPATATNYDQIWSNTDLTLDGGTHTVTFNSTPGAGTYHFLKYNSLTWDGTNGFTLPNPDPLHWTWSFTGDSTHAGELALTVIDPNTHIFVWDIGQGSGATPIADGAGIWVSDPSGTDPNSHNWRDIGPNTNANYSNANTYDVVIGNNPSGNGGIITLGGDVTVGGKLTFGPIATPYTITDGGNSFGITTTSKGVEADSNVTISAAVSFSGEETWNVATGKTLTLNKGLHAGGGDTLAKSGAGTLIINNNTNSGGSIGAVTINVGTLETNDLSFIQPAIINIGNGTTLRLGKDSNSNPQTYNLTGDITANDRSNSGQTFTWDFGANNVTLGGTISLKGSVTKLGTGDLTLSGSNTSFSAAASSDILTIQNASTLHLASGTPMGVSPSWENLAYGAPITIDVPNDSTIGSLKNGPGLVTKTGNGKLTVSTSTTAAAGTNPAIDITAGSVQLDHQSGLGGGNGNTFGQMAITLEPNTTLIDNFSGSRNSLSITMKNNSALTMASTATTGADSEFVGYNTNGSTFTNYGAVLTVQGNATIQNMVQTAITQDSNNNNVVVSHQLDISMPIYVTSGSTLTLTSNHGTGDYSKSAINLRGVDDASGHSGDGVYVAGGGTVDASTSAGEIQFGSTGRGKSMVAFGSGTATFKLGSHAFMRDQGNSSDTFAGTVSTKLVVLTGANMRIEAPMNATYSDPTVVGVPAPLLRPEDGSTGLFGLNTTGTNGGGTPSGYTRIDNGFTVMSPGRSHNISVQFAPDLTKLVAPIPGLTGSLAPTGTLTLAATDGGAGATGVLTYGPSNPSNVALALDNTANSGNLVYQMDGAADGGNTKNFASITIQRSFPSAGTVKGQLLSGLKTPKLVLDTANGVQLDIGQKAIVIDHSGTIDPNIATYLASGKNGGAWNGVGIMSTGPDLTGGSTSLATIVEAESAAALGLSGTATQAWRGRTVDADATLVAYVYRGDANLDGKINADDYFAIDSNYNKPPSGYIHGDFNEDGQVNGDDYAMIDMNYPVHPGPLPASVPDGGLPGGVSAVPEPATLGLGMMALAMLAPRRRRRS